MNKFRVKTSEGYFFTTGHGRYARFYGSKLQGEVMCAEHAQEELDWINENDLAASLRPAALEAFLGHAACAVCKRLNRNQSRSRPETPN